jgi:hypothetical protein
MAEIIDLQKKQTEDRRRKAFERRSNKMTQILKTFQCSRCAMKCMKCGSQMETAYSPKKDLSTPYKFCDSCGEEYREFLRRLHGRGDPEEYWYNQEWMGVWKAWMHYQDSLGRYEISEGFRRLLKEFKGS